MGLMEGVHKDSIKSIKGVHEDYVESMQGGSPRRLHRERCWVKERSSNESFGRYFVDDIAHTERGNSNHTTAQYTHSPLLAPPVHAVQHGTPLWHLRDTRATRAQCVRNRCAPNAQSARRARRTRATSSQQVCAHARHAGAQRATYAPRAQQ